MRIRMRSRVITLWDSFPPALSSLPIDDDSLSSCLSHTNNAGLSNLIRPRWREGNIKGCERCETNVKKTMPRDYNAMRGACDCQEPQQKALRPTSCLENIIVRSIVSFKKYVLAMNPLLTITFQSTFPFQFVQYPKKVTTNLTIL